MHTNTKIKQPLTVMMVNIEGQTAGAEKSLLLAVMDIDKHIKTAVICPKRSALANELESLGINVYNITSPPRRFNCKPCWLLYLLLANLQITFIALKLKPYLIHANTTNALLSSIVAKVLTKAKLIWHVRDLPKTPLITAVCNFYSSGIIAVSKTVKNILKTHGVNPKKIDVIYNGVTINKLQTETETKKHKHEIVFANIGQFVPWKNQLLFIQAAEKFLAEGYRASFIVAGDDIFTRDTKYKKKLIKRIETSPFKSMITRHSWQADLEPLWSQIDCLIHTAQKEPFGRVIIEAMAHNVPVIAPDNCTAAEIIENNITGLLFKAGDITKLVTAMKTIADNKNLAHRLTKNAKMRTINHFSSLLTSEKICKVYEKVLAA